MNFLSKIIKAFKTPIISLEILPKKNQQATSPEPLSPSKQEIQTRSLSYNIGDNISIHINEHTYHHATILQINPNGSLNILNDNIQYNNVFILGSTNTPTDISFSPKSPTIE